MMLAYSRRELTVAAINLLTLTLGLMVVVSVIGCYVTASAAPSHAGYWEHALAILLVPFMPASFAYLAVH
jgi:hypothetical protein